MKNPCLIDVIPVSRNVGAEILSYFAAEPIDEGTIVHVSLRKRTIPALVVGNRPVRDVKSEIRSADFEIKKITSIGGRAVVRKELIEAARRTGRFFVGTTGSILNHCIPQAILESSGDLPETIQESASEKAKLPKTLLQTDDDDRVAHYKRLIRESFARKESIFFCVPTTRDASRIREEISRGIEEYTFTLHGSLPRKEIVRLWKKALAEPHPILIVATGLFISLPRHDLRCIVLEQEHSSAYRSFSRPYFDLRMLAEQYADAIGARIIFGDSLVRIETLWRADEEHFAELAPVKFRSFNKTEQSIIDMRPYSKEGGKEFSVFSEELMRALTRANEDNYKIILFATRRGLAPSTVCGDCGNLVRCTTCKAPIVLHRSSAGGGGNFFLCHSCGERRDAAEKCAHCDSWKLVPLGIGTERVEEELARLFPTLPRTTIDSSTAPSQAKLNQMVETFLSSPKGVLVGTESLLYANLKQVETVAIVSLDSLFSIPDFRIHEKIVHLILSLRSLAQHNFILQTRNPSEEVLKDAYTGHLADFYRRETSIRERFKYPPFSVLIKVTLQGDKDAIAEQMERLRHDLEPIPFTVFPAFIRTTSGKHALHGLMKIPRKEWVDERIFKILRSLPPDTIVQVNPESLF